MYTQGYDLGWLSQNRELFLSLKELSLEMCFAALIIPTSNTTYIPITSICYTCCLTSLDTLILGIASGSGPSYAYSLVV